MEVLSKKGLINGNFFLDTWESLTIDTFFTQESANFPFFLEIAYFANFFQESVNFDNFPPKKVETRLDILQGQALFRGVK